jgi:hypothetical protein
MRWFGRYDCYAYTHLQLTSGVLLEGAPFTLRAVDTL